MTPERVACGFIGTQWVYEIAEGRGFVGELIVGVSVIDQETGERNKEMSDLVTSKQAAYELVDLLREEPGGSQ